MSVKALDVVFCAVTDTEHGQLRFKGIVVDVAKKYITVAIPSAPRLSTVSEEDVFTVGGSLTVFTRLPPSAISLERPSHWENFKVTSLRPWPAGHLVLEVYNDLEAEVTAASSYETLTVPAAAAFLGPTVPSTYASGGAPAASTSASANPALLSLLGGAMPLSSTVPSKGFELESDFEEDAEEVDDVAPRKRVTMTVPAGGFLPPGVPAGGPAGGRPKKAKDVPLLEKLSDMLPTMMAQGELSAKDLVYFSLLSELVGKKKQKSAATLSGDSDSDDLDVEEHRRRGLRQFNDIEEIKKEIRLHSRRLVKAFEKEAREAVGVEPGMPWTMQDYRKACNFGKHVTLNRAACQDLAVFMQLARVQPQSEEVMIARAQLAQNFRSKHQAALDGGN